MAGTIGKTKRQDVWMGTVEFPAIYRISFHPWTEDIRGVECNVYLNVCCYSTQARACALIDKACLAHNDQNHLEIKLII